MNIIVNEFRHKKTLHPNELSQLYYNYQINIQKSLSLHIDIQYFCQLSEAQPDPPLLLSLDTAEDAEEDGLIAGDAQLRVRAELVHLLSQVQQRPEQGVVKKRRADHEPLELLPYIHHQVPLGYVLRSSRCCILPLT